MGWQGVPMASKKQHQLREKSLLQSLREKWLSSSSEKALRKRIRKVLGFRPKRYALYEIALVHSSAVHSKSLNFKDHNERLEYLGDSVLDLVIADYLYQKYPDKNEGGLTRMRSALVNRVSLNRVADELGISDLIIGKFNKNITPEDVKGNALEALVGAIYLDRGLAVADRFIRQQILDKELFGTRPGSHVYDFKSELFMWAQKEKKQLRFDLVYEENRGEIRKYIVDLKVDGDSVAEGEGPSKKKAQQVASKKAIQLLGIQLTKE